MRELKAKNGLIYEKDGDGWTVVASCITGIATEAQELAELLASAPKLEAACEEATWALRICRRWLKERGYTTGEALAAIDVALKKCEDKTSESWDHVIEAIARAYDRWYGKGEVEAGTALRWILDAYVARLRADGQVD